MSLQYEILKSLGDGCFHSGQDLAGTFSVSRAAIWKAVKAISRRYGVDIHSVRGRGYCLSSPLELLEANEISRSMIHAQELVRLETFLSIDSTNQYLMQLATEEQPGPYLIFAEHQTGGKGRRGRHWVSPFSGNIYMSLLWRFRQVPAELMGLSLAIGVSLCRTMIQQGIEDISLKWPNDVLCLGRKLCGILVEMHGETNGPYAVVVGLGLNIKMSENESEMIDQPWIAMENVLGTKVSRNPLAARLADNLIATMKQFEISGLETFISDWSALDAYKDQAVTIHMADQEIKGIARGIDSQGALLVEHQGAVKKFYSGEISLRADQ